MNAAKYRLQRPGIRPPKAQPATDAIQPSDAFALKTWTVSPPQFSASIGVRHTALMELNTPNSALKNRRAYGECSRKIGSTQTTDSALETSISFRRSNRSQRTPAGMDMAEDVSSVTESNNPKKSAR